jgi:hypothetical protein
MEKQYRYGDRIVHIEKHKYANGRTIVTLVDANDTEDQVACVTANLAEHDLQPGEIFVKTWGGNESMVDFLVRNNLVFDTGREVPSGPYKARVVRLLI